jgi:hypothetical protein
MLESESDMLVTFLYPRKHRDQIEYRKRQSAVVTEDPDRSVGTV